LKNRKSLLIGCCTLFILLVFSPNACGRELVLLVEHFPPWTVVTPEGIGGINVEIVEEIASRLNIEVTCLECPWKRCLKMMQTGAGDAMTSLLRRPEREEYMAFIEPPYKNKSSKVFYLARGQAGLIGKYEDLYSLEVGVTLGAKYFEPFDSDTNIKKRPVKTDSQNIKKLALGRLDALIGTESNIDYLILEMGVQERFEKAPYRYDQNVEVYMGISRKSPFAAQVARFNTVMKELVGSGTVDAIIRSYFQRLRK